MNRQTTSPQVRSFLDTITPEILSPADYVDWDAIEERLGPVRRIAASLQRPLRDRDVEALAEVIHSTPGCLDAMFLLVGHTPTRLSFSDPDACVDLSTDREAVAQDKERARAVARTFLEMATGKHLRMVQSIEDVLLGVLIGLQPNRRKSARGTAFESAMSAIVRAAVAECSERVGCSYSFESQAKILDKRVDYLVYHGTVPVAAVETNFFSVTGSKPSEVLERSYPDLQRDLTSVDVTLIVVTDGAGWRKMPRVLERAFQKLDNLMNLRQARAGALRKALIATTHT